MPKPESLEKANDYTNLVQPLALFSEATNRMSAMQNEMQGQYLELIDDAIPEYAELQSKLGEAETALETLTLAHPEWFTEKRKSIKTPYGTVKLTATNALDVPNEEATIILIEAAGEEVSTKFLRKKVELNREALESLTEAELKPFRIKRIKDQSFKVTAAQLDMGKAVKEADKAAGKEASK